MLDPESSEVETSFVYSSVFFNVYQKPTFTLTSFVKSGTRYELLARLEKETFTMDLDASVTAAPSGGGFEFQLKDPKTLVVTVKKGQQLNEVFKTLSEQGIKVLSMRNETGRLEEPIFNGYFSNTALKMAI